MSIINTISQLGLNFSTSFKHTANVRYNVLFENSNVCNTVKLLKDLQNNFNNGVDTLKHVGYEITSDDICMAIDNLNDIVNHYKLLNNIQSIPSKLKIYEMTEFIRENEEKRNVKDLAKDVVREIINPMKTDEKLTRKQIVSQKAEAKSMERKLKLLIESEKGGL